jgi:PD-(D/E)XK nuclease superfamily
MLRVQTPLSDETKNLIRSTIAGGIAVHRALGPGLLETITHEAARRNSRPKGIEFEREKAFDVLYRGQMLYRQRLDFVVERAIVSRDQGGRTSCLDSRGPAGQLHAACGLAF